MTQTIHCDNRTLARLVRLPEATQAVKREYADRVSSTQYDPQACEHGHDDCALTSRGPCSNEFMPDEEDDA